MTQSNFCPDEAAFEKLYRGEPTYDGGPKPVGIPWDIGGAQPSVVQLAALGGFSGNILDVGCGLGDNALFLASLGYRVVAVDGSATAIDIAHERANELGVHVDFQVADATRLDGFDASFDTILDSALLHCLPVALRGEYLRTLHRVARPDARLHLFCFSDGNVNGLAAPIRAVPTATLEELVTAAGWSIDYCGPALHIGTTKGFAGSTEEFRDRIPPEAAAGLAEMVERYSTISRWVDDDRVVLPFTAVHARRKVVIAQGSDLVPPGEGVSSQG